jgi:hypothetical protein
MLAVSAQMHGERAKESEVVVDSTVQEKNVTYRLDTKGVSKNHYAVLEACGWKRGASKATLPQGGSSVHNGASVCARTRAGERQGAAVTGGCAP